MGSRGEDEIAKILNIAEQTVVFHIHNAMEKLGVTTKVHAVAKAVSIGLIKPKSILPETNQDL